MCPVVVLAEEAFQRGIGGGVGCKTVVVAVSEPVAGASPLTTAGDSGNPFRTEVELHQ